MKKNYEGEKLLEWKNYNIKYETIRCSESFQKEIKANYNYNHYYKSFTMEFDIKKYLELNKEWNGLIKTDQSSIANWDKRKEYRKLSSILHDNVQWQSRYEYYELINNFVENKATIDTLFYDLGCFNRKDSKRIHQLKNNLNSETISFFTNESYGFANLIMKLENITNLFDYGISDSESSTYGISENVLKEYLKKEILSELQKYCKK